MKLFYITNTDEKCCAHEIISATHIGDDTIRIFTLPTAVDVKCDGAQPYIDLYCPQAVWKKALERSFDQNGDIYVWVNLPDNRFQ